MNLVTTVVDGDPARPTLFLVEKGTPGFRVRRLPRFAQRSGHGHPEIDLCACRPRRCWARGLRAHQGLVRGGPAGHRRPQHRHGPPSAAELALAWARERRQFGRAILDFQAVEFMLADMATDIMAGKSMLYRLAQEIDSGLERKIAHARASAVKYFCSEAGFRVVDKAVQIFGGRGTMCENPVERLTRDIRLERIWEGTSEIQKVVMAGQIRKRGFDVYTGWA